MTAQRTNLAKRLFAATLAVLLVALMAACGKSTIMAMSFDDGSETINVNGAKSNDSVGKNFTVEEGKSSVAIHSEMKSGTLHITLKTSTINAGTPTGDENPLDELSEDAETVLSYDAIGNADTSLSVAPGEYFLTVVGDDASPATGLVTITPKE